MCCLLFYFFVFVGCGLFVLFWCVLVLFVYLLRCFVVDLIMLDFGFSCCC